jgi:Cof subfamily protein (haloacid dehalogenase superfamily)
MNKADFDKQDLKNVKLIASDMDNTLLTANKELPPNFNDYIVKLNDCGIDFTIASGRPFYMLKPLFGPIADKMSFIGENGAIICHKGEMLYENLMTPQKYLPLIISTLKETDGIPIISGVDRAFASTKHKALESFFRSFYSNIIMVDDLESVPEAAGMLTIYFPNHNAKKFCEQIFIPKYGHDFSATVGDTAWVDIMNLGVNKGAGIKFLAEHLGINHGQIMAFGDTYNDIEMLRLAKFSYIVENAHSSMAEHANFVTDSNENFGVLKVLDEVLESHRL